MGIQGTQESQLLQIHQFLVLSLTIMKKLFYIFSTMLIVLSACSSESDSPGFDSGVNRDGGSSTGQGGSLARFAIVKNFLYVVDHSSLHFYDLSDPGTPAYKGKQELGIGIETIYPDGNFLYIGSENGMYTYDISNPSNPRYLSMYQHITSCDPVVVQGNYAYVTLRSSSNCRWMQGANQLDVVNISDKMSPWLVRSVEMTSPIGLAIKGSSLFVCQGENGMAYFNASNPDNPNWVRSYPDIKGFDLIMLNSHMIVTALDGLHQYDYSDPKNLKKLSSISVK